MENTITRRRIHSNLVILKKGNLLLFISCFLILLVLHLSTQSAKDVTVIRSSTNTILSTSIQPFNCHKAPQSHPVFANIVEGLKFPFHFSLSDFGNLPDKPSDDIVRMLNGKPFGSPEVSSTIQELLEKMNADNRNGIFVDIGANVGMATFAAAVMGFKVLAFEPVYDNLQKICDGIHLNRVADLVQVFEAAVSDGTGNITFHKLIGQLDNSAVSAVGANVHIKSNEAIAMEVKSICIDEVIQDSDSVVLMKIDVQGWEYHVLKGALKLLSRKKDPPYLIYEEDELLLQASNSSSLEIRQFLGSVGYTCTLRGADAHCTKKIN